MMNEYDFKLLEPTEVAKGTQGISKWALSFCLFSSLAISLSSQAISSTIPEPKFALSDSTSLFDNPKMVLSQELVTKLNSNAKIKQRLLIRLANFKDTLKDGWNGESGLPIEKQSLSNTLAAIDITPSEEFEHWTIFPSPNGTILFSPTDDLIGGISIGNTEFSYAAIGESGQEIKGKKRFSGSAFALAIRLINTFRNV